MKSAVKKYGLLILMLGVTFPALVKEVLQGLQELARTTGIISEASLKFPNDIYTLFGFGVARE